MPLAAAALDTLAPLEAVAGAPLSRLLCCCGLWRGGLSGGLWRSGPRRLRAACCACEQERRAISWQRRLAEENPREVRLACVAGVAGARRALRYTASASRARRVRDLCSRRRSPRSSAVAEGGREPMVEQKECSRGKMAQNRLSSFALIKHLGSCPLRT